MIKVPTRKFANSSFAILEINGKFLLQKRDGKKSIWYPSMLGLFGGKIEKNENENQALKREVLEETNLEINSFYFLNSFKLLYRNKYYYRHVFYSKINKLPDHFSVNEGSGYILVDKGKLSFLKKRIVPTDYISLSNYLRVKYGKYLF